MKDMAFAFFLALIIGMAGGFYWFFYRPAQARSECEKQAIAEARETFDSFKPPKELKGMYSIANKDAAYISCMRQHGIEG